MLGTFCAFSGGHTAPKRTYILALNWPQSKSNDYLRNKNRKMQLKVTVPDNKWTVHGLWIDAMQSYQFESSTFKLHEDAGSVWPSLKPDMSTERFILQQWRKHGNTFFDDATDYQTKTIALSRRPEFDVFGVLEKNGIVPDDEKTYNMQSVVKALEAGVPNSAQVLCTDKSDKDSVRELAEVRFCMDEHYNRKECPTASQTGVVHWSAPVSYPQRRYCPSYERGERYDSYGVCK